MNYIFMIFIFIFFQTRKNVQTKDTTFKVSLIELNAVITNHSFIHSIVSFLDHHHKEQMITRIPYHKIVFKNENFLFFSDWWWWWNMFYFSQKIIIKEEKLKLQFYWFSISLL